MSQSNKHFVRPKVRFCRSSDAEQKIFKEKPKEKPRIKSIEIVKKPIRIIKESKASDEHDVGIDSVHILTKKNKEPLLHNSSISNTKKISDEQNAVSSKKIVDTVVKESDQVIPKCTKSQADIILDDHTNVPLPLSETSNVKLSQKEDNVSQEKLIRESVKKGKENKVSIPSRKKSESNNIKNICEQKQVAAKQKMKHVNIDIKKCPSSTQHDSAGKTKQFTKEKADVKNTVKTLITNKPVRKTLISKPVSCNVMPCHKYKKMLPKAQTTAVKKTVVRDIYGQKIKPYIGPGVLRVKHEEMPKFKDEGMHVRPDIISSENLARPEYNSIMCTINKLNEVKNEKIVADMEHLPSTYKNLINSKVSAALDFPLDKAIYKNLVNLSIDEKQLPSRLTRTKDPEPRQKDIVPKLSDFFTPEMPEEYCTPVCIKPRLPEVVNDWNAFRISDKILQWKHNMDND